MIITGKPIEKDAIGIQNVYYQTWLVTYPNKEVGVTEEDIIEKFKTIISQEGIQRRREEILNTSEDILFLVAKDGEKVVGLCKAEKDKDSDKGQLSAIYILPTYQGKGIGKMLWNECALFFKDTKEIYVNVATYNEKAIGFYEKLGFVETGKRIMNEKYKMPVSGVVIPEIEMVYKRI